MSTTDITDGTEPASPPATNPPAATPRLAGVWTAERQPPAWVATAGMAGVVVLLVAGLAAQVIRSTVFTAEAAVADYFTALASRDAASLTTGRTDLLATSAYTPPSAARTESVIDRGDGTATVTVSYEILGQRFTTSVPARRDGWWGPWLTTGVTASLDIAWPDRVDDLNATVAGAAVHRDSPLHLGAYVLGTAANDAYVLAGPVTVAVTGQTSTVPVTMPVVPNPELVSRLDVLLHDYLDTCATEATTLVVPGCPLRYSGAGLPWPQDITWRIDAYPRVDIVIGDTYPLEAVTTVPGAATVTYRQGAHSTIQHVAVDIDGEVTLSDGTLAWHPDNLTSISE